DYKCASKKFDVDDDLKKMLIENKYQLPWIPYDKFSNFKEIGKGGFATVYSATWDYERYHSIPVAHKIIDSNDCKEFIQEVINDDEMYRFLPKIILIRPRLIPRHSYVRKFIETAKIITSHLNSNHSRDMLDS
ncbi:8411_t:CDS:2, partial [Racocetra fulgida]